MEEEPRAVTWEAPEHHYVEKGNDWYFALVIIVVALIIAALLFNNVLFALLIGLAGGALMVSAARRPEIIEFAVTARGIRIGEELYPYSTLEGYHIDEEDYKGPHLLVRSSHHFEPLLVLPLPADHVEDIEHIIKDRIPEEMLHESLFVKILELFGF